MPDPNWDEEWIKMTGRTPDRLRQDAPKTGPQFFGRPVTARQDHPIMILECQVCGIIWTRRKSKGLPRFCPSKGHNHPHWYDGKIAWTGFKRGSPQAKAAQARVIRQHAEKGHTPRPQRRHPPEAQPRPVGRPKGSKNKKKGVKS